jgi:hypothetical protein
MANYDWIGSELVNKGVIETPIFKRFPELIPFEGEKCSNKNHSRLLIICESNYFEDELESESNFKEVEKWYKDKDEKSLLIPDKMKDKVNNGGKIEYLKGLKSTIQKLISDDPYYEIALYNYFLRPASVKIKNGKRDIGFKKDYKDLDGEVAFVAFCGIIESLKPDLVIFASALAWNKMEVFKNKQNKDFGKIAIKQVSHPSSPWWNKNNGAQGRQLFEDLLWEYWFEPINPIIKELTQQLYNSFQANPFWNKEIWGDINWYDEKDATCAYFDNISKNISIDIYCSENDKYQFQIFERDYFKTKKPSGKEWIQNIPNLTTKCSRQVSRLQSRQEITEVLEKLLK